MDRIVTQKTIDNAPVGVHRGLDAATRGFALRVTPNGARTYILEYRADSGKRRRMAIGDAREIALSDAKRRALNFLDGIERGDDPLASKRTERQRKASNAAFTFDLLFEDFIANTEKRTVKLDRLIWRKHIGPRFGSRTVNEGSIERDDVTTMKNEIGLKDGHKPMANRAIALLSAVCNLAIEKKKLVANPCARMKKFGEVKRDEFIKREQMPAFQAALDTLPPLYAAAFRMMLFTGCRKGELLAAKWRDFAFEKRGDGSEAVLWSKPASTTKTKQIERVRLNKQAIEVLKVLGGMRGGSEYLFPSTGRTRHLTQLRHSWERVQEAAGLGNIRIHDIRHTFGSWGVSYAGLSLPVIGKLLGHHQPKTTMRYAHLAQDTEQDATDATGEAIDAALNADRTAIEATATPLIEHANGAAITGPEPKPAEPDAAAK